MVTTNALLDDLGARGLIHDTTDRDRLAARLDEGPLVVYCGFDPTADSLHVGNLVSIMGLVRLAQAGHTAVALAGGGSGRPAVALFAFVLLGGGAMLVLPRFTADRPQPAALRFVETATASGASAVWGLDPPFAPLPPKLAALAAFERRALLPWSRSQSQVAAVAAAGLAMPELEKLAEESTADGRHLRLHLRSPRAATRAALWLPAEAGLRAARVAGGGVPAASGRLPGTPQQGRLLIIATLPPEGVEIELTVAAASAEIALVDASPGLPATGAALAAARGETAVPIGLGDSTWTVRRLTL